MDDQTTAPDDIQAEGAPEEDLEALGKRWLQRIEDAEKRESQFLKDAEKAEAVYSNGRDDGDQTVDVQFNILHSNVETIVPSTYNSTPQPDIRERFNRGDETPETSAARQVAAIFERAISFFTDDGALDGEVEDTAQNAFLAGRGVTRVRFTAAQVSEPDPVTGQPMQKIVDEGVEFESVSWRDYREGPAKRWRDVPWVAFAETVADEAIDRMRDPALREALKTGSDGGEALKEAPGEGEDAKVWQVWDKETRRVLLIVDHSGEVLSIKKDPLRLKRFFPMPEPVQPLRLVGRRTPIVPYIIYQRLAEEIDTITKRIRVLVRGLRARGIILADDDAIRRLANADDNQYVAISDISSLAAQQGLDKVVHYWPIDKIIAVVRELYLAREQAKSAAYEITGISDIIRGQGKSGETATAQQIKTQWGSLRIKRLQKLLERHAVELFKLSCEIMTNLFSHARLQEISGIQITPEMQPLLQAPMAHYRIDVESDSTVRADLSNRRDEMARFLEGTAQYFQTMGQIVQQEPALKPVAIELFTAFARHFSLGKQAEDALEKLAQMANQPQPQQEQGPDPIEAARLQLEAKEAEGEHQMKAAELQLAQRKQAHDETMDRAALVRPVALGR